MLNGTIPASWGNLSTLSVLDIPNNAVSRFLPLHQTSCMEWMVQTAPQHAAHVLVAGSVRLGTSSPRFTAHTPGCSHGSASAVHRHAPCLRSPAHAQALGIHPRWQPWPPRPDPSVLLQVGCCRSLGLLRPKLQTFAHITDKSPYRVLERSTRARLCAGLACYPDVLLQSVHPTVAGHRPVVRSVHSPPRCPGCISCTQQLQVTGHPPGH